ncbi:MAG: hypothetical protein ACRDDZ_00250 [Marinifilaceae bacterium]
MNSVCIFCGQETVISSASSHYCTNCGSDWLADSAAMNVKQEKNEPSVFETSDEYDYSDLCSPI